jgi:hypothetical protein
MDNVQNCDSYSDYVVNNKPSDSAMILLFTVYVSELTVTQLVNIIPIFWGTQRAVFMYITHRHHWRILNMRISFKTIYSKLEWELG